jgi:hypothetical protein
MLAAERRINDETADTAYDISYYRRKNSEIGYSA